MAGRGSGGSGGSGGSDWRSWEDWSSTPIAVEDGIATSRQRGAMAEAWWSQRFVEVLEAYGLGGRMERGRRYARKGQLVSFEVMPGELRAEVQGSRSTPYAVTVRAPVASEAQWALVDEALAARVRFAARLLAGEVPPELEEVFADAGMPLLPASWRDLRAHCSCPDDANPCKHIAATLYVFADQLDADPWLLLTWRGRTREQILEPLFAVAGGAAGAGDPGGTGPGAADRAAAIAPWWPLDPERPRQAAGVAVGPGGASAGAERGTEVAAALVDVDPLQDAAAVLARLQALDVVVRDQPVGEVLAQLYPAIVERPRVDDRDRT